MIRTGVDIVLNSRFDKLGREESFLSRVFHNSELKDKSKLISIFALKEAVMKAIGRKVGWHDIEIKYEESGMPVISISSDVIEDYEISGSVSHDGDYTIGFVVMERED